MDLTVSIVNYNTKGDTRKCLQSIFEHFMDFTFEVVIHDNASSDGSREMIRTEFPQAKLILNDSNLFYTRAQNKVLDIANGEYILFLNSDTYFTYNAVKPAIDYLRSNSDAGLLSIINKSPDEKITNPFSKFKTYRNLLITLTFLNSIPFIKKLVPDISLPFDADQKHIESEIIGGCFQLIKTSLAKELKGFDTEFLGYFSDDDISCRVLKKGYKNVALLKEYYYHKKLGSAKSAGLKMVNFFIKHDAVVYARKYFGLPKSILLSILIKITNFLAFVMRRNQVKVPKY